MRENKIYEKYVAEVFGYFKGCKEGEGCFFFRQLGAQNRNDIENVRVLTKVMVNLIDQGYFYSDDGNFMKLTEKGYAYTQDGQLEEISIDLKEVINYLDQKKPTFQTLWTFIGKENEAPFYVTGPEFFNVAKNFVHIDAVSYSDFMNLLQQNGQSTSRVIWYNSLFKGIKPEEMDMFLDTLSRIIRNAYNADRQIISPSEEPDLDELEQILQQGTDDSASTTQPVSSHNKTIFVSYSHDTPQHEAWVDKFAKDISSSGIKVITDADIRYGQDTNLFMEESVAHSDRVLIVITAKYKSKADGRMAGVGYETGIITGELVNDQNTIKFIPIIREGCGNQYYPRYLGNRWGADFTDDAKYNDILDKLIEDILKV